jgi:hypothetical protein
MEITGDFDRKGSFRPDLWPVWRMSWLSSTVIQLELVDPDFWAFDEVDETRRAYERVIRKHANDPDLAPDERVLVRIPLHDLEYFSGRINQ